MFRGDRHRSAQCDPRARHWDFCSQPKSHGPIQPAAPLTTLSATCMPPGPQYNSAAEILRPRCTPQVGLQPEIKFCKFALFKTFWTNFPTQVCLPMEFWHPHTLPNTTYLLSTGLQTVIRPSDQCERAPSYSKSRSGPRSNTSLLNPMSTISGKGSGASLGSI